jgi:hypothetical protein
MSNTGKFVDQAPFLRNAGVTTATEGVSTDHSLRQDIYFKVRNFPLQFRNKLIFKFFKILKQFFKI